jgi:hypothetical protein
VLPKIVTSVSIPKGELWLYTPGEYLQFLSPGEEPESLSFENVECKNDTIACNAVWRRNGTTIQLKPPQVHKIINIGE